MVDTLDSKSCGHSPSRFDSGRSYPNREIEGNTMNQTKRGRPLLEYLAECRAIASNAHGRRLVSSRAITVNGSPVITPAISVYPGDTLHTPSGAYTVEDNHGQ